jgi:hypothetical protein
MLSAWVVAYCSPVEVHLRLWAYRPDDRDGRHL